LERSQSGMGEVRVAVKLTNAVDEALVRRGMLTPEQVRTYQAEAPSTPAQFAWSSRRKSPLVSVSGFEASGWPSTPVDARRPSA